MIPDYYVSAFEFGVSPPELDFQGSVGENICKNLRVFSSLDRIDIVVDDKWAKESNVGHNIGGYEISSADLSLTMDYEKNFILNKEREIKVCLKADESGEFKGVLFFQALDKSLNIGIWMNADISGNNQTNRLTGFDISDLENYNYGPLKIFLPLTTFNLFLLLVLLAIAYRKKKKR